MKLAGSLFFAAMVLTAVAALRGPEYDEAYSIFLTAGDARPAWPVGVFEPRQVRSYYSGVSGFGTIARDLRADDVHPPLYFWLLELWRRAVGPSWFAARLLSVLCSVAALALLAWLAAMARVPAVPAVLLALFFYGFAYTGIVARGFALAQLLNICGVGLVFAAGRGAEASGEKKSWMRAFAGMTIAGLALGAAGFTNYLAVFVGVAALGWLAARRRWAASPAVLGFALFLPADTWFYIAQRQSRIGQFVRFSWRHSAALLVKDGGAALFGGLPVYAGSFGPLVAGGLLALAALCAGCVIRRWRREWLLFALTAGATPIGLLALGVLFNNTPIEIRYLAFGLPPLALLLAAALPRWLLALVLALEICAVIGLAVAPATMQPQGRAARAAAAAATPDTLVLVPFGNDGVGIPGPFVAVAPDDLNIELLRGGSPDLGGFDRVILVTVTGDDQSRRQIAPAAAAFPAACWRQSGNRMIRIITAICPQG
jgi:hypothetical protein